MVDGLKSPASVQAPMTLSEGMPFEQVSLMFSQMQQMLAQMQQQNEQMHLTLQLLLQQQYGKSSEQLKQNPDWQTLPLFAPDMIPHVTAEEWAEEPETSENKKPKTGGRKPLGGASHVVSVVNEIDKHLLDHYRDKGYSVRPMPSTYTSYFQRINAIILVEVDVKVKEFFL
jgi:hypothetical protein